MPDYTFHPELMLRIPAKPYTTYDPEDLAAHLDDTAIRNALLLASPALYHSLSKAGFAAERLNEKQKRTLSNYINRLHYRCTPFGLFAGTAMVNWTDHISAIHIQEEEGRLHLLPDHATELELYSTLDSLSGITAEYYTNATCHIHKKEIRYLRIKGTDGNKPVQEYELKAITASRAVKHILAFCSQPRAAVAVTAYLSNLLHTDKEEAEEILLQLRAEQLLCNSLAPNITGTPYFQRIRQLETLLPQRVRELISPFIGNPHPARQRLPAIFEPDEAGAGSVKSYAHLKLSVRRQDSGLHHSFQQHILDGVYALERLLPQPELPDLKAFREAFSTRFDQQCISLMQALDPELGVGYAGLGQADMQDRLTANLKEPAEKTDTKTLSWTAVHTLLLQQWNQLKDIAAGIQLTDTELRQLPQTQKLPYASGMPVLFRLCNEQLLLEQAGGATATALAGRFSLFHEEAEAMCRNAAQHEMKQNPEVLFAEICSIQDKHAANIEKRKQFYNYEIPVLTHSLLPQTEQVLPNDLWIKIRHGRIILFSARHRKEVIPRLSSAFNFQRSTLGLYRFLCDMQYQGLSANAVFQLSDFFPGMQFYPRVTYKDTILQLATWIIDRKELDPVFQMKEQEARIAFMQQWLKEKHCTGHMALTEHDNQLVFDLESVTGIRLFLDNIKDQQKVTLKEFPFAAAASPVKDSKAAGYQQQFMAALMHYERVYEGVSPELCLAPVPEKASRKYMPGSEWLYFKFYCHPGQVNDILLKQIRTLLKRCRKKMGIRKWFFLRFTDTDFHIRFRVQLPEAMQGSFLEEVYKQMDPLVQEDRISRVQLDTYEQEWERYDACAMDKTEQCFYTGSEWALQLLQSELNGEVDNINIAVGTVHYILNAAAWDYGKRAALMQQCYLSLHAEHGLVKEDELELSDKYRNLRGQIGQYLGSPLFLSGSAASRAFEQSIGALTGYAAKQYPERVPAYLSDMIHVQLNRIFTGRPRKREMVICYLMWKWYHAETKRNGG